MDSKKDIFKSWVEYTTKNDETYFRQFISGFVNIWEEQISLDFHRAPFWNEIKTNDGPALQRLPEELMPAIEKFLIISRDEVENGKAENLNETSLLMKCLTIICRHFDNIETIYKSSYIANVIAVANHVIQKLLGEKCVPRPDELGLITASCNFLEVIYDPYLTWRSFTRGRPADFNKLNYNINALHPEIVPFIYYCFQAENILEYPDVGVNLINVLGSVVSGSQQNGLRAISPATISILIHLISKWECSGTLRRVALSCFSLMTHVLQKSSPEQRQIDLPTIFPMYINAVRDLLQTEHFKKDVSDQSFEIDHGGEDAFDVGALKAAIENITTFVSEANSNKNVVCGALIEAKFVPALVEIPFEIASWHTDLQETASVVVRTLACLCHLSDKIQQHIVQSSLPQRLFDGLKSLGRPSRKLVSECLNLAFNFETSETLVGEVVIKLVEWLPEMIESEQNYVAEAMLKVCQKSLQSKQVICEKKCIGQICVTLLSHQSLSTKSILLLISLVEELAKYNIYSVEVKQLLQLLRTEVSFNYRKQLLETVLKISHSRLSLGVRPTEFLDIQHDTNGITIPDIRKWDSTHGFVFHIWLRLDPYVNKDANYRRHVFSLTTSQGHGFEFFIQKNGNFVVSVITRKETLTATVASVQLLIGNWHSITVVVAPPKRLFSYYQVNVYLDGHQKLGSTMKFVAFHEPFIYCSIGAPFNKVRRPSNSKHVLKRMDEVSESPPPEKQKSIFPSIFDKAIPGLVSQSSITSYFTLQPLKNASNSFDPSVKPIPTGMQDTTFGELVCLKGQIGHVILADSSINLKSIFDAGPNFANIIANDLIESFDVGSRFVFCYSPTACSDGLCLDLAPGNKFNGYVMESYCRAVSIQDSINGVGGVLSLLPILDQIISNPELYALNDLLSFESDGETTPVKEEINAPDWEVLENVNVQDAKITKNPIACFLCLMRNFITNHELNQECMLKEDAVAIIGSLLMQCRSDLYDVNILMAMQLLIEAIQNNMPVANLELLRSFYRHIVFDFRIWARTQFQIIIGHIQYIQAIIKEDRKYFRKYYGVQFMLDVVLEHFVSNSHLSASDGKTVREALFKIVKYYILKDVNIKEISSLLSFIANVKNELVLLETLTMLRSLLENKICKDQTFLLMYEPHMAELLYALLIEKNYSTAVHQAALELIICILGTKRIATRHKASLKLQEMTIECKTLWPGLFSYILPLTLEPNIILILLDQTLASDSESGYSAALCLIYHLHLSDLDLKLEVARRMLTTTFIRNKSPQIIAKQVGWQESIARLLIKKTVDVTQMEKKDLVLPDMEEIVKNEAESSMANDLIVFDEESMEFKITESLKHNKLTEAASMIENELKDLAATASGAVVDNITSVYSVIRQKTSDITDTLESLSLGGFEENKKRHLQSMSSSEENMSFDETLTPSIQGSCILEDSSSRDDSSSPVFKYFDQTSVDDEETLVHLVSNILFTILWRGVENTEDTWKERGQVMACINLIALNNELYCSHLSLRLRLLEMGIQATLMDLADNTHTQSLVHQQNAAQLLRLTYDLVVLYPKEDESKTCSTKLLDGMLSILDSLMVFQKGATDDWSEMIMICLGLLLKLIQNPNSDIVAMASAKLHGLLQSRVQQPKESAYLIYSLHGVLSAAIERGNPDHYSFLMPIMKAMLEKTRDIFDLPSHVPDLPDVSTGPVFFQDFQIYATTKQWTTFIERKIRPLYQAYEKDVNDVLSEPLNTFWAECFEACKETSNKRVSLQMESRRKFNERIWMPWRIRLSEEGVRLTQKGNLLKAKDLQTERRWHILKRYLYGKKGVWAKKEVKEEFWKLSHHENVSRMRLKLEPNLYHDAHTAAANLRDNTVSVSTARRLSTDLGSTIAPAALGEEGMDEDNIQIEEEIKNNLEAQAPDVSGKEKIVIQQECELITLMMRVKGRLDVTTNQFIFTDLSQNREDGKNHDFRFGIQQLREVHLRKYNLRRSALEIFLVDQTSYFLNFTTKTRNKIYSKILSLQPPNILYGSGRSPSELLKSSGYTQKWINREISNFEYLMHLNTIAGRSYNDLSQYPVFPWVLADYTSDELNLTRPESFRDLSKPIGVVNPKNEGEVRAKYEGFEDPSGMIPKFHYGTHYSNSAGVLHYMIRVEPFTSLHIELQSGRFDVADRQFHSIPQTWKLLMDNPNDVKELIPEFFYFPEFLKNMNRFDLGSLQNSKERVDDVVLPPWAKSAEDFVNLHRKALESDFVSANLHHWIDLIFGYKQKGPRAVDALNVFYYCSYEGAVDLDKITDEKEREAVEGMINNFGQTPSQLLREPHPRRLSIDECLTKLLRLELRRPDLTHFLDRVNNLHCDFSTDKDPVIYLSEPKSPPRSFLQTSPDLLISVTKAGILGSHSWLSYDKERGFLLETDATTTNLKNRKRVIGPFHPSVQLSSNLFAVSSDGKYLYSGGIWDNSLRVFNTSRGKVVASVIKHFDIVTCVALDNCGSYLVTGSKDCTCIIWSLNNASIKATATFSNAASNETTQATSSHHQMNVAINSNAFNNVPKPIHTLYGHDDAVACVAIMTELDLVVSGSLDGAVNVYTIEEGQYVRTIQPQGCSGPRVEITYLTISYQGQIAFSALDDKSHSVHVYSINGANLGSKYVSGRVTGLTTASDHLVVADDAGDITMHRLFGLKPVFDIPLHIPTQTVVTTSGNTHILVPLRDGGLSVVGVTHPSTKKHAVFYV